MKQVTVVGGGMAGLAAALRLADKKHGGFRVTLLEQDDFLGGKFGAHAHTYGTGKAKTTVYYEHCYHMFLNWFNNFWRIVDELGLRERFAPNTALKFLRRGEYPRTTEVQNVGSPATIWQNLFSGVIPPADVFIWTYSTIDLLAQPFKAGNFLDRYSVNGFMRSRPYATNEAAIQHQRTLAKAFACPSDHTSAWAYKNFLKYGFRHPDPMMWILKGNCEEHFHLPLRKKLEELGVDIQLLRRVDKIQLDEDNRVRGLRVSRMNESPTIHEDAKPEEHQELALEGYVIMAVPPKVLGRLVDGDVFEAAPELANARKLRSLPMATLDLRFKKKLPNMPYGHVVLKDAKYHLTFIDNSQIWPDEPNTGLCVVASDIDAFDFDDLAQYEGYRTEQLTEQEIKNHMIEELHEYVPFDETDIDWEKTHIQSNTGEMLFLNEVANWPYRPKTTCGIPNMMIAGDFCQSFIDVVTIEGAVVTGLMAAEEIRARENVGEPIEIIEPDYYPETMMNAFKLALAPYAYAAKLWAWTENEAWSAYQNMFPPAKR